MDRVDDSSYLHGHNGFHVAIPLLNGKLREYADFFVKIASIYTGILGVIVGYYFGRAHEAARRGLGPANRRCQPNEIAAAFCSRLQRRAK